MTNLTTQSLTVLPDCWCRIVRKKIGPGQPGRRRVALLLGRDAVRLPGVGVEQGDVGVPEGTWRRLRLSRSTFWAHVAALVEDGYLIQVQRAAPQHPAAYRLALPTASQKARPRLVLVTARVTIPDTPAALLEEAMEAGGRYGSVRQQPRQRQRVANPAPIERKPAYMLNGPGPRCRREDHAACAFKRCGCSCHVAVAIPA